ncbi:hypothetical protein A2334_03165 [Candidatus Roizmanbacteria bacterium RIFOXYB2_FULL_38_10]|uniref:Histidine phosphatase family protein n=1 Tax=Candidatus Roizmanbacteria bacterium RIFOXYD1_FULL_38_12 TaxID=1802093 RepID=A0A1F7L148_9BACT|nr:MAG: hypothetical protein A3K47_03680 [Candidatus Roizmanbacteria bacterium RIFOXYA2_FULL_38_14]OGK63859.1 MAG: hypothetical protein A3K27_03680 [Candidatus Roizmanbacteria bacterium RIFOXYA1_FULL_37_12]OGK65705.1 MAG: hypothetical protein A3K38_03680 [Candidatus Roizmanbacteria bacterium RIFOXYB1_FULL_40_23]OGK67409.1 MAG: hypothetical protein A2334_03165 [Candidatus Roizmanbacteria bacterium RIFOXYB2_FULL_38_10]OGK70110.1 MAG: hypothetical protein A3K21_03685 [Candidatus Roizmanbacteria ba
MGHPEAKESVRGTNVLIDVIFVRHAEREPVTPEMIAERRSPALTAQGMGRAREWGRSVLHSNHVESHYDRIFFTGTSIPRTHHTVQLIDEGASLTAKVKKTGQVPEKGQGFDNTLRLRPDGKQWNNQKIIAAGEKIFQEGGGLSSEMSALCNQYGQDYKAVVAAIQKAIATDNSVLPALLERHFPPQTAKDMALKIASTLYDTFIDPEEVRLYIQNPLEYLKRLVLGTLPNQISNTSTLIMGVTHDFNIAGIIKGMLGKRNGDTVEPIQSFMDVGGAPDYLSYLHFKLKRDEKGNTTVDVYYNGVKYELLPEMLPIFFPSHEQ